MKRLINIRLICFTAVVGISFSTILDAAPLLDGKTVCLEISPPSNWGLDGVRHIFKIKVGSKNSLGVSSVAVLENYEDTRVASTLKFRDVLAGNASIAVPNGSKDGETKLIMELSGTNQGVLFESNNTPGVWVSNFFMVLDPKLLTGNMSGIKTFTPGRFGVPDPTTSKAIENMPIRPTSCLMGG